MDNRLFCINKDILDDLSGIFEEINEGKNGTAIEFNGEPYHIHLLFETLPQIELVKLVNTLKTVSSRLIRKKHSEYLKKYYWKYVFLSRSYCFLTT